jgi:hypothetical protein
MVSSESHGHVVSLKRKSSSEGVGKVEGNGELQSLGELIQAVSYLPQNMQWAKSTNISKA